MRIFKKKKILIDCALVCPDGEVESLGYDVSDCIGLEEFISFVNLYANKKGYSIRLRKNNISRNIGFLMTGRDPFYQDEKIWDDELR